MNEEQMKDIIENSYAREWFVWCMDKDNDYEDIESFFDEECIIDSLDHPTVALMIEEGMMYDEAESAIENDEWKVLEEYEASSLAREYAEYMAENARNEIVQHLQPYFNEQDYIEDLLVDGEGYLLAPYDGEERDQVVEGTTYYLYRQQ